MKRPGFTVWLTGLPSSGKSTLAHLLENELDELGFPVEVLDGDEVRQRLAKGLGYTREDREENIRRIAYVAKLLARVGAVAIVAAISPYRDSRERAKAEIQSFVEVHVHCPLQVCIRRDVKGLYAKAMSGEIANFTGVSDPYEPPTDPDILVQTHREPPEESLKKIMDRLAAFNFTPRYPAGGESKDEPDGHASQNAMPTKVAQWSI